MSATIGVLTVSDRVFRGEYTDRGGPAIESYVAASFVGPPATRLRTVPDEQAQIEAAIRELAQSCGLILTTGGTGPAPRDVTPEATRAVCEKELVGFGERMRAASVEKVPTAILSRATAGVCGKTVVINLPGSPKAVAECLDAVIKAVPHAVRLVGGGTLELRMDAGREKHAHAHAHTHAVTTDGACEGCGEKH